MKVSGGRAPRLQKPLRMAAVRSYIRVFWEHGVMFLRKDTFFGKIQTDVITSGVKPFQVEDCEGILIRHIVFAKNYHECLFLDHFDQPLLFLG